MEIGEGLVSIKIQAIIKEIVATLLSCFVRVLVLI